MEIILRQNIPGLGYKDDLIKVKSGYGRNYLIPQGFAIIASHNNRKMIAENIRQAAHKADKIRADAEELANAIGSLELVITTKAGESGKIFGAVTTLQLSDILMEKGFDVNRKNIAIQGDVKNLGEHSAILELHKEVKKEVIFQVVSE
jgi:large subunit ribosomal protein L9